MLRIVEVGRAARRHPVGYRWFLWETLCGIRNDRCKQRRPQRSIRARRNNPAQIGSRFRYVRKLPGDNHQEHLPHRTMAGGRSSVITFLLVAGLQSVGGFAIVPRASSRAAPTRAASSMMAKGFGKKAPPPPPKKVSEKAAKRTQADI